MKSDCCRHALAAGGAPWEGPAAGAWQRAQSDIGRGRNMADDELNGVQALECGAALLPEGSGGRTTNSPPSNVKTFVGDDGIALASGIDSLVLAVDMNGDMTYSSRNSKK